MRFKLALVILMILGPVMIVGNYRETAQRKQIAKEGLEAVATPTAKIESRRKRGGTTYKLDIQFQAGGVITQQRVKVSRETYDNAESSPGLKIKYLKEDPSKIILVGEPLENPSMYTIGGGMFLVGALGTGYMLLRRSSNA